MIPEYPKKAARVASVLALVASLVWVELPIDFTKFNIASIVIFVASLVSWISIEIADFYNDSKLQRGHEIDDINKINKIADTIDRKQYYTLSQCNVETYISSDSYAGIEKLIAYGDVDIFPFHNIKLQEMYKELLNLSADFIHDLWQLYTSDGKGRATWRSSGESWIPEEKYKRVLARIATLNDKASKIALLWEKMIVMARKDITLSSHRVVEYEMYD